MKKSKQPSSTKPRLPQKSTPLDITGFHWLGIDSVEELNKFKPKHIEFLKHYSDTQEQTEAYRRTWPEYKANADQLAYQLVSAHAHVRTAMTNIRARLLHDLDDAWLADKLKRAYDDHYDKKRNVRVYRVTGLGGKEEREIVEDKEVLVTSTAMDALDKLIKLKTKADQINVNTQINLPIFLNNDLDAGTTG